MYTVEKEKAAGSLFLRCLLGIIFLFQGYGKIMTLGIKKVYDLFFSGYEQLLPKWIILSTAYYTSYIELMGGVLLVLGLFKKQVLYLLALDLIIVSVGHGLLEPIWDLQHVFPRAILIAALLLLPQHWDKWSLNFILFKKTAIHPTNPVN